MGLGQEGRQVSNSQPRYKAEAYGHFGGTVYAEQVVETRAVARASTNKENPAGWGYFLLYMRRSIR
jgi:hypothetical protein